MVNWKLRLQNKATLLTLATTVVAFVYTIMAIFGITPDVGQDEVLNIIAMIVSILAMLGIVIDPTTAGIKDSQRAMEYTEPNSGEK